MKSETILVLVIYAWMMLTLVLLYQEWEEDARLSADKADIIYTIAKSTQTMKTANGEIKRLNKLTFIYADALDACQRRK